MSSSGDPSRRFTKRSDEPYLWGSGMPPRVFAQDGRRSEGSSDRCRRTVPWVVGLSQVTSNFPLRDGGWGALSVRGARSTEVDHARRHCAYSSFGDAFRAARPASRAPSTGLSQRSPLRRHHRRRVLPRTLPSTSAGCDQHPTCSVLAVSLRLDGLRLRQLASVLQLAADPGVHGVSAHGRRRFRRRLRASSPVQCPPERFPPR